MMLMKIDVETKTGDFISLARSWYLEGIHSDVSIQCGTDSKHMFKCHKLLLRPILLHELRFDISYFDESDELIIPDLSPEIFQDYVGILYGMNYQTRPNISNSTSDDGLIDPLEIKVKIEDDDFEFPSEQPLEVNMPELTILPKLDMTYDEEPYPNVSPLMVKQTNVQHVCHYCHKTFKRQDHLTRHLLQHTGERPFQCTECPKAFTRKDKLNHHLKKLHLDKILPCLCGKIFMDDEKFDEHIKAYPNHYLEAKTNPTKDDAEDEDNSIPNPDPLTLVSVLTMKQETIEEDEIIIAESKDEQPKRKKMKTMKALALEMEETGENSPEGPKPEKKTYKCQYCEEEFNTFKKRKEHYLGYHYEELKGSGLLFTHNNSIRIKVHFCPMDGCEKSFRHSCEVTDHVNVVHKKEKNYICELCSKAFPYRKSLRNHMDIKHDMNKKESILCPKCGDMFSSKVKLQIHISSKHKKKIQKYNCKYCDFKTHAKNVIIEHERTHTGEKPEICQWCGRGFNAKKTLRNHERLHTGEKPYHCKYCENSFAQRTSLNVHLNSHHKAEMAKTINGVKRNVNEKSLDRNENMSDRNQDAAFKDRVTVQQAESLKDKFPSLDGRLLNIKHINNLRSEEASSFR